MSQVVRRYLDAIERKDAEALAALLAPDLTHCEYPNLFAPTGNRYDRQGMLDGLARGAALLAAEEYTVEELLEVGERVVCRLGWRGTTAVELAGKPAGTELRADLAVFFTVRDGLVREVTTYDCVTPFA